MDFLQHLLDQRVLGIDLQGFLLTRVVTEKKRSRLVKMKPFKMVFVLFCVGNGLWLLNNQHNRLFLHCIGKYYMEILSCALEQPI